MTVYLFVGPSVSRSVRDQCATKAVVLPPVAGGDLLRIGAQAGDAVGIIDGFFYRRPAVKHKEILDLLTSGVLVYGAASMGALRAAELADFGMVGMGRVFADYRSGAVIRDDEVALLHGTAAEDYEPFTMALINVRYALMDAAQIGLVSDEITHKALAAASRLPFMERTLDAITDTIRRCGVSKEEAVDLEKILRAAPDVKQEDALSLIKDLCSNTAIPEPVSRVWQLRETSYLRGWRATATGNEEPDAGWVSDTEIRRLVQVLAADYPAFREGVALRALAAEHASHVGLPPRMLGPLTSNAFCSTLASETGRHGPNRIPRQPRTNVCDASDCEQTAGQAAIYRTVVERLKFLGILAPDAVTDDGLDRWCTAAEIAEMSPIARTAKAATRVLFTKPELRGCDDPFLRELKSIGGYTLARERLIQCLRFNRVLGERYPAFQLAQLKPERILAHFALQWDRNDLDDAVLERGFATVQEFVECARPYYLYDKHHPEAPPLTLMDESTGLPR